MSQEIVVDALVLMDDKTHGFMSLMPHEKALEIQQQGGLQNCEQIILRETTERPIPQSIKEGTSIITDILVKLEPTVTYCLN